VPDLRPAQGGGIAFSAPGQSMNVLAKETISIDRPAALIFDYVSNMENFGRWFQGVIAIEAVANEAHGTLGKTYLETVNIPLRGSRQIKLQVIESRKPTLFVTEGDFSPVMPRMEITITECGLSSRFEWKMYSRNHGILFRALLLPLIRSEITKRAQKSLPRLKAVLEQKTS